MVLCLFTAVETVIKTNIALLKTKYASLFLPIPLASDSPDLQSLLSFI